MFKTRAAHQQGPLFAVCAAFTAAVAACRCRPEVLRQQQGSGSTVQGSKVRAGQPIAFIEQLGTFVPVEVSHIYCCSPQARSAVSMCMLQAPIKLCQLAVRAASGDHSLSYLQSQAGLDIRQLRGQLSCCWPHDASAVALLRTQVCGGVLRPSRPGRFPTSWWMRARASNTSSPSLRCTPTLVATSSGTRSMPEPGL